MANHVERSGDDLEHVLEDAVAALVDADVSLTLTLPDDLEIRDITVRLTAAVASSTDEPAPSEESESEDSEEFDGLDGDDNDADDDQDDEDREERDGPSLDDEADAAADFIEGVLDALNLPGHLKIQILDDIDQAEIEVVEVGSGALIGRRGQTLESIQELLRSALQREFQRRSRVKVDVEGYRARRLEKLLEKAEEAIEDVLETGTPERLEPMDVFERKAVHRLVASYEGVASRSQGREPARRIVIEPE
jgi:spoIIIJ-associated protein